MDTTTVIFFKNSHPWIQRWQSVDTATAWRGHSDGKAWIQRQLGVDTATACHGTFPSLTVAGIAFTSLYLGFFRRYSDGLDI